MRLQLKRGNEGDLAGQVGLTSGQTRNLAFVRKASQLYFPQFQLFVTAPPLSHALTRRKRQHLFLHRDVVVAELQQVAFGRADKQLRVGNLVGGVVGVGVIHRAIVAAADDQRRRGDAPHVAAAAPARPARPADIQ